MCDIMLRPKIGFKPIHAGFVDGKKVYVMWDGQPKRQPQAGEYYISGAPGYETGYLVKTALDTEYFIAIKCDVKTIKFGVPK